MCIRDRIPGELPDEQPETQQTLKDHFSSPKTTSVAVNYCPVCIFDPWFSSKTNKQTKKKKQLQQRPWLGNFPKILPKRA